MSNFGISNLGISTFAAKVDLEPGFVVVFTLVVASAMTPSFSEGVIGSQRPPPSFAAVAGAWISTGPRRTAQMARRWSFPQYNDDLMRCNENFAPHKNTAAADRRP